MVDYGDFIRKTRKEKNMTQAQLADSAKLSVNTVRLCEAGKVSSNYKTLEKIAEGLGFSDIDVFLHMANRDGLKQVSPKPPEVHTQASDCLTTGQRIKAAREKIGITQADLAKKLGVACQTIAQWENDFRNPEYDTLKRIAEALNLKWMELVPEVRQWQFVKEGMLGFEPNIDPDDDEFIKRLFPKLSELDLLTVEETALKTLLNLQGYDFIKSNGKYFFTYESGGSEISEDDLRELLNCAQNGLRLAAKSLELRLLQEAFKQAGGTAPPAPGEAAPTPPEGKDQGGGENA